MYVDTVINFGNTIYILRTTYILHTERVITLSLSEHSSGETTKMGPNWKPSSIQLNINLNTIQHSEYFQLVSTDILTQQPWTKLLKQINNLQLINIAI